MDVASGTGDIALRVAKIKKRAGVDSAEYSIIASDICRVMLELAKAKKAGGNFDSLSYRLLNAHDLHDILDDSVDIYAISFAMKICDRERVLHQAMRVLRPGGMFVCLEASHIPVRWVQSIYLKYMEWCIPMIAMLATRGDKSAYNYLTRGIREMPNQRAFLSELEETGFESVSYENMTFGIVALHCALKAVNNTT